MLLLISGLADFGFSILDNLSPNLRNGLNAYYFANLFFFNPLEFIETFL